jgi:hypothetical protein
MFPHLPTLEIQTEISSMKLFICQFCGRETTNVGANKKHEISCKNNPNSKICGGNKKGNIPWNTGKTGVQIAWNKGGVGTFTGRTHSDETKIKMSESKRTLYASGWECIAGRCPKYDYESPIAGKIKVDGSWELEFCRFADEKKLNWKRNKKRFPYTRPDGKTSTYQPDFYVEELNSYIEVKGYETDLDIAKWKQFPEKLIILRKKEIGGLDEWLKSLPC